VKLIIGLGNPGIEYQFTPHNLGFLTVDQVANDCGVEIRNRQCRALTARAVIGEQQVLLAKPETYMNLSGLALADLVARHEIRPEADLIVVYDELDLPFGSIRIKPRGSSAGHNGMESLIGAMGSEEFVRIRLGIAPERRVSDGAAYVLKPFRKSQLKAVDDLVSRAADAVQAIVKEGLQAAMNRFNRKPEEAAEAGEVK